MKWQDYLVVAERITQQVKAAYPGCEDAQNNFGAEAQSTAFRRSGTSKQDRTYALPSGLSDALTSLYVTSPLDSSLSANEDTFLSNLFTQDPAAVPSSSVLSGVEGLSPTSFSGSDSLATLYNRNPYSGDYENNTNALYERSFDKALSALANTTGYTRGGAAASGHALADVATDKSLNRFREVNEQQRADAGVVSEAVQVANAIEAARRGSQLQATGQRIAGANERQGLGVSAAGATGNRRQSAVQSLNTAAEYLGNPKTTTTDNLSGAGNQTAVHTGFGCCFIMMAAYGDRLPWFVRPLRDFYYTPARERGYKRMSRWLVPLMRHKPVRFAARCLLTGPITAYGRWLVEDRRSLGWVCAPITKMWFRVWERLGKE